MPLITEADARALTERFRQTLTNPVAMDLFVEGSPTRDVREDDTCEGCAEAAAIAGELASLSDRIALRVHDLGESRERAAAMGVEHAPTLVVSGAARGSVRFLGAPSGYEFGSLVVALEAVSHGRTSVTDDTRRALASLSRPAVIRVFVTPTCPYCPRAAAVAQQLAVESDLVTAEVVQANEFPDLAMRYRVHSVPKIVINDAVEFVGAQPEAAFVDAVRRASSLEPAASRA